MTLRLAEYQVRLLLGAPAGRQYHRILWKCGCTARELAHRKFEIEACADHSPLLCEVHEGEEPTFDSFTAPTLRYPSARPG